MWEQGPHLFYSLILASNRHSNEYLLSDGEVGKTWRKRQFCPGKAEPVVKFHLLIKHPWDLHKTALITSFIQIFTCQVLGFGNRAVNKMFAFIKLTCRQSCLSLSTLRHQHLLGHHFLALSSSEMWLPNTLTPNERGLWGMTISDAS